MATLAVATADAVVIPRFTLANNSIAPADDPGWYNVSPVENGTQFYLGNQWMVTAGHVNPLSNSGDLVELTKPAPGNPGELISGFFPVLQNSVLRLKNPSSAEHQSSDVHLFRIGVEQTTGQTPEDFAPGVIKPLNLVPEVDSGGQMVPDATQIGDDVMIIGNGNVRFRNNDDVNGNGMSYFNLTPNANNITANWSGPNDTSGNTRGYAQFLGRRKIWGTNTVESDTFVETQLLQQSSDTDHQIEFTPDGADYTVVGMVTRFDIPSTPTTPGDFSNEFQAASGDSGSPIFRQEATGDWVLAGVTSVSLFKNRTQSDQGYAGYVVEGQYTGFSDLSDEFYYNQIVNLLANDFSDFNTDLTGYSINGDVNLDGVVSGDGSGDAESDDVTAFVEGWLHSQASGDVYSWQKGDLNLDGSTNLLDFVLMRDAIGVSALPAAMQGIASSIGYAAVPEPAAGSLFAVCVLALTRRRRR